MEVTVPETVVPLNGQDYYAYVKRDIATNSSDFVLDALAGGEMVNASLKASDLLMDGSANNYKLIMTPMVDWLKVAEDSTTNAGLAYLPAITALNNWYANRSDLDPVTTIAAIIAVSGPITKVYNQPAILNVVTGDKLISSRASISLPNGITTSYQYDSLNRLTNLTHKKADTLIASYTYNLLSTGRRSAVTEVTPEGTSQINYTYDNLYRLTNETRTGVNPFTASYAYDINSNRTQKVETVNGITETINYEYNANDQLLSEVSSANGTTVYTYDVNGSLTNKANEGKFSYQYGYDLRNRLATASITRKEGTADVTIISSYAYNADGIRTRALQTINGNTQNRYFLLDDGHTGYAQVFEETAELGGSIVRSYTIGDDVLCQTVAGVTSHLLYDGHGSTRQLADNNGAVTSNYTYDAYGKMLGGNPGVTDGKTSATDLLYAGEQFDSGLQMEYLRARYYDQDNGRFNRLDPFEGYSADPQSLHKYAYAHCDPVNGIDPSGEFVLGDMLFSIAFSVHINLTRAAPALMAIGTIGMFTSALVKIYALIALKMEAETRIGNVHIPTLADNIANIMFAGSTSLMLLASTVPYVKYEKISSAARSEQIGANYKPDSYIEAKVKSGSVLLQATYSGSANKSPRTFFFDSKAYLESEGNMQKLKELLQLKMGKDVISAYVVKQDVSAAIGVTRANPQFGAGGVTQYYINDSSKLEKIGEIKFPLQ